MAALLASTMDVRAAVALRRPFMDALSALPAAFCALHSTAFSLHSLVRSPCRLHVSVIRVLQRHQHVPAWCTKPAISRLN